MNATTNNKRSVNRVLWDNENLKTYPNEIQQSELINFMLPGNFFKFFM